jgi:hypothetical protein
MNSEFERKCKEALGSTYSTEYFMILKTCRTKLALSIVTAAGTEIHCIQ